MQNRRTERKQHGFEVSSRESLSRFELTWKSFFPSSKDAILKKEWGFIVLSYTNKSSLLAALKDLKTARVIADFQERQENITYSAVILSVDENVKDGEFSAELRKQGIDHHYCKRIIALATNKPTANIRVITRSNKSYDKLVNEGASFKGMHYRVRGAISTNVQTDPGLPSTSTTTNLPAKAP